MNNFVNTLIERHAQPGNNVQPQVRSRFETSRNSDSSQPALVRFDSSVSDSLVDNSDSQPVDRQANVYFGSPSSPHLVPPVSLPMTNPNPLSEPEPWLEQIARTGVLADPQRLPFTENRSSEQRIESVSGIDRRSQNRSMQDTIQPAIDGPSPFLAEAFRSKPGGLLGESVRRTEPGNAGVDARPDQVSAAPAQPIIRVTIGRIDVRAVPSANPAPPQPRSGPRPQLSLEDYLKQRNTRD